MNKNNLNRIKGILSAKQGTQIPKFQGGYTIYHTSTNQPLYSKDGTSWFTDQNYMNPFTGNLNEFTEPELGQQGYTKNSNIVIPNTNNSLQNPNNTNNLQFINEIYKNLPIYDTSFTDSFQNPESLQLERSIQNRIINPTSIIDNNLSIKSTEDVLNDMNKSFVAPTRTVSPVETNIKLDKEDRKLSRQLHREERQKETQEYLDNLSNKDMQNGQLFMSGMDTISDIGSVVGASQQATDSELTKNITTGYDAVASAASNFGPMGQIVGGAMKALGALGDMSQAVGGGTDQQTKLDSWMDSPLLSWNVGMINGFFGKNTDKFGLDQDTLQQIGSSYGGAVNNFSEIAESADKKYGLFSSKARKKANNAIAKAKSDQTLMGNIADTAADQRLNVQSMGEQAGLAYSMMTNGGYDQKYTYAAKQGGILEHESDIKLEWEPLIELNWELHKFKEGGNIDIIEELEWTPKLQKGDKTRTLEELIEYAKKENPRFIQRMSEPLRFIRINFKDEDGNTSWAHATHEMNYKGKDVFSMIQEIDGKLYRFDSEEEAYENAKKNNNILTFDSEEEAKLFAESGQNENGEYYGYKLGWQDFFNTSPKGLKEEYSINQYKQGGFIKDLDIPEIEETNQKNVIPEGALHKNKHHMEHAEGLTKKGIPVIDEEGEQQAEIEHSEIIFTLEVTKKLEEYYQIFYSEESTNKEKEQATLDAGKLLVYQILENTEDRTGLIESCKKGGILKKSMTNLTKEVINDTKDNSKKDQMKNIIKEIIIELLTE